MACHRRAQDKEKEQQQAMNKKLSIRVIGIVLTLIVVGCGRPPVEKRLADTDLFHGVSLVGMTVSKLEDSEAFYRNSFGLQDTALNDLDFSSLLTGLSATTAPSAPRTKVLRTTNFQMLMMEFDGPATGAAVPVNGPGIAHMCYQADKTIDTYQKFLDNGARHIGDQAMQSLSILSPVEYAYAHDPDGLIMEIEHVNFTWVPDSVTGGFDRRIRHVSYGTPDVGRLIDFYAAFFDVEKARRSDVIGSETMDKVSGLQGSKLEFAWVHVGNMELEFIQYHSHPVQSPAQARSLQMLGYNMILLDVADVDQAAKRLLAAGGSLLDTVSSIDGYPVSWGRDVDGNLIGLFSPAAGSPLSARSFDFIPSA